MVSPPTGLGASARTGFTTTPTPEDPYSYQTGFGNRFASEAVPGTLPIARNTPQKCKYDLFSEQINGTPFVSPRASQLHAWFYRIRPSVAHKPFKKIPKSQHLEAFFSASNLNTQFSPSELAWAPFPIPPESESVDFVQGLKTIGGNGDPMMKEGLAVHVYCANISMGKKAFCNNDGDMMILPQQGRIDVQTEFGRLMVRPGELLVIQAGMRFKVTLPDGPVRGYIQEIYGTHYELPELGPVGSNGMALSRDFEFPIASFDVDQTTWEICYKLAGELFVCEQEHTPFDVVAWHGNYVPYKYALEKFVNMAPVEKEQADPSIYCVLMAKSKVPGIALTEFLVFTPKWCVTTNTFRPPYYHRNVATEIMGMPYGSWAGSSMSLEPGGLTYEPSYMPHGESYDRWKEATTADLEPMRVAEGAMAFMFHITAHVSLTQFALKGSGVEQKTAEDFWSGFTGGFISHLEQVNKDLAAAGLPTLSYGSIPAVQASHINGNCNGD